MKQKFYRCQHCGNVVDMVRDCGASVYCCGEKMQEIVPDTVEASGEKHIPVYHQEGNAVTVWVGAAAHPMTPEHHIAWICLETKEGIQYKLLDPEEAPQASFALSPGDDVEAVYAFCNQHSLWKNQKPS